MPPVENPFQQQPAGFTTRQPLFPADRPDVQPTPQQPVMQPPKEDPRLPTINQMVDDEVRGMVNGRLELSKQWRRTRRIIWDKCVQNFKGIYDSTNKESWQSTTFMPLTVKMVEVIVSNMHQALLSPDMPIEYQARRFDLDQTVRSHNEIIQSDFEKCFAKAQLTDFLRNLVLFGTSVGEIGYLKQTETVMVKESPSKASPQIEEMLRSMNVNSQARFVPKKMLVKDYATITNIDIYDIYPEPRVAEFSKDHWVIHKSKITNRELKMGSLDTDPYYKFDNVTDDLLQGSGLQRVDQDPELQTKRFALLDYNLYTHFLDPDREHELATYYGQIPLWFLQPELRKDPKRQYDSVPGCIKVVDGHWVIWKRLSPWRDGEPPYFKGNYIRVPHEFYGIGVPELVMGLQTEKNEIRNGRMDNINIFLNKIIAVNKDLVPRGEWNRLVSKPGAIWPFKGIDDVRKAVQVVEVGDITKDSWASSAEIDREAEEVTAANKDTQAAGGAQGSPETFRGQMLNVQQASGRWMLYSRLFEWTGFIPAMKKFYGRIYQFKDLADAQEILGGDRGKNFQFLAPEDMEKIAKLVSLGVMTMENKGVKLAQENQFAMLWKDEEWFKKLEYARKMAIDSGIGEPDSILFSDEEMKQYNQAKQAMLAQAQQMPGIPGPNGMTWNAGISMPQRTPQSGQGGNVPGGQPVSGNVPGPTHGMPRPASPARGPGASPVDLNGRPLS